MLAHLFTADAKLSEDVFCFSWGLFSLFVPLLGLRGRAGGREGRREGRGWIFPRETLIPSHF